MEWLTRTWRLKVQGNSKALANYESPNWTACEFLKGHHQPDKVNTTKKNLMKEQDLKKEHLLTEHTVFANQNILRYPGRLYHERASQIHMKYSQANEFILTMTVVILSPRTN